MRILMVASPLIMGHDKSEHINSEISWETLPFSEKN